MIEPFGRDRYATAIIVLHWTIVLLILVQLLTADGMEEFFRGADDSGVAPGFPGPSTALIHASVGATILILMLTRFVLRMKTHVPPPPSDLPIVLQFVARATHYGLYVTLVFLPLTGVTALLITPEAGDAHEALKTVLYVLAGAHILGALTHLLILRDGVFWRMVPINRR
jgi:cytochrome b561